jgi:HEPN domain-containing protein/predicted nucleotidyltransferase
MSRNTNTTSIQTHIDHMVQRIVKKFHPEKIILFGSQARGDARPDSDVDLLIVMPVKGSVYEKRWAIRDALRSIPVPVDVIVTTPENFAWRKDVVGTIEWPAAREGKVLATNGLSPEKEICFMPKPNPIIAVIREWIAKAEDDLQAAAQILKLGAQCPTFTVCFHAQQCVEKYLKAFLVFRATPFSKMHNIHDLWTLLPSKLRPKMDKQTQDLLTSYAVVIRYPEGAREIPLKEARQAVAIARRVRREIRRHLPRAALRRQKK